jgi:hypothetical protein
MKAQCNVPDKRPLADFAPTIILKAKDFATELTIFNVRGHGMKSEGQISAEYVTNNEAVRKTPELHHKVYLKAAKSGKSLNRWISDTLESA